ncbi:MAG: adenylosuccinate synthase [Spirochaetales bacterium]|jgi:adenylosuccinate synthase|nr:adenylosuccinate synthase [Spirochaetales bacterium]
MNLVVIGAQWGDEGKGKIVDFLAERADVIVRYSGGANAGHTIVHGGLTYKLHLVPSGIIYPDRKVVMGIGMVIDPEALFRELGELSGQGVDWKGRVFIADRAHLVLPRYREIDIETEKKRRRPIGTTGRGIGVAYAMKSARDGIRIADLYDEEAFAAYLPEDREYLLPYREKLKEMVVDMPVFMHRHQGQVILFEGAQGTLLDLDLGTYPFVSSGMSCAAGATTGSGIGPRKIDKILGVFKAYSTRVGNGPFPSEFRKDLDSDLEETIRSVGREYGVTTGRPRRCGYLDLVALRYACLVNSIDGLVLTHLDVYDGMDNIKVCTAYEIDGKQTPDFPAAIDRLTRARPVTQTFKGWKTPLGGISFFDDLPTAAKEYVAFIEQFTQTPVDIVSVGYERKQTIVRKSPWTRS